MNTSTTLFCEHCGAANESQAITCCFCERPLHETKPASYDDESGSLLANTMLKGRYRIIKAVGQGGMGTVYRAQDTELNDRPVAVKEMILSSLDPQAAQEAVEAFKREAILLAGLQHPNLPSVFEHFEENDRWYMVMSFIQGETLEAYLERTNRNKLPLDEVLRIGKQLCTALHYLHNQYPPIIFRDVKPANIMRAPDGQIYLIDFGVARRFKPGQKRDTVAFGSVGYAPPEQFGKAQTTPRSDIYSLGATLYQLLSGHEPDSTPLRFPPLLSLEPTIPTKLATLIHEMLEMDEEKRPANTLIIEQKLQEISSVSTSFQPFPSFTPSLSAPQRQSRPLVVVGIIFSIICSLVIGGVAGDFIGAQNANTTYFSHTTATAVAQANATTTAQINATATVQTQEINATATVQTQEVNATATVLAARPDPYQPQGKLVLADPLSRPGEWQENSNTDWGGSCQFTNGALQASQSSRHKFYYCDGNDIYKNFAIEVKMTITQGDCGGIVLRQDTTGSKFYFFDICATGAYHFYHYTSNSASDTLTTNDVSSAIKLGTQTNTIAVVANGSNFDLYVNNQKVESVTDSSYNAGTIGFVANDHYDSTTVTYQDAMIWALP